MTTPQPTPDDLARDLEEDYKLLECYLDREHDSPAKIGKAAIRRAIAAEAKLQWQSIETAPKGGKAILLCVQKKKGKAKIFVSNYWQEHWLEVPGDDRPTHWMPVPEPPK